MQVCEVGVWTGETTIGYANIVKQNSGHIYVVDWFQGNIGAGPGPHSYQPENVKSIKEQFLTNLIDYLDIITILEGISWEMAKNIPDQSLDLCFIDADHRYESVRKDIQNFLPKVKNSGILCGHDCEYYQLANTFTKEELASDWSKDRKTHPGVVQAVFDFFGNDIKIIKDYDFNETWVKYF